VGVRLHDVAAPAPLAVVVPCCGNATEFTALERSGLPLVRYDVRNRGESDTVSDERQLGFDHEVRDLGVLLDVLEVDRAAIVAWSYHAAVAVRFALDHPDRVASLALAAAVPTHSAAEAAEGSEASPAQLARLDQLQAAGMPSHDPAGWCEAWREVYVPLRMGRPERFTDLAPVCHLANERPEHVARSVIRVLSDLHPYDFRPELRALAPPVLVVHGTADPDPIEHAEEWVQCVPDGRLLALDGVGTIPWVEDRERFFPVVSAFVRGDPV
jgi:pimeloyl-ACP methyl ester carboxylesterase